MRKSYLIVFLLTSGAASQAWQPDPAWVAPYMKRLHALAYDAAGRKELAQEAFKIASQSKQSRTDSIKLNLLMRTESTFSAPRSFSSSLFQNGQKLDGKSFYVEALCGLAFSSPTYAKHIYSQFSVTNVLALIDQYPTDLVLRRHARRYVSSSSLPSKEQDRINAEIDKSFYDAVKGGWEPISNEARHCVSRFLRTQDESYLNRGITLYKSLLSHKGYPALLAAGKPAYIKHLESLRKKR